jgi:conjugal transfer pilus assembly protein TraA
MFTSTKNNNRALALAAMAAFTVALTVVPDSAFAGTGGTEFDAIWTTISDWMQGTLGRIIAGSMILVGLIAGVVRQSLMAFAVGIGGGIGLFSTPGIVNNVMTATLEQVPAATEAVFNISNGLM